MGAERNGEGEAPAPTDAPDDEASRVAKAIDKLRGRDGIGKIGDALSIGGGLAAGAAAAGTIAGAAGATTFLGSSALGSIVGGVLVTATPVGWIAGCALAGGAAAFAVARLVRSGSRQDKEREAIRGRLEKRLENLRLGPTNEGLDKELDEVLADAVRVGVLTEEKAHQIRTVVSKGALKPQIAIERIRGLLAQDSSGSPA